MSGRGFWYRVRSKAHVVFPALALLDVALILTSPLYSGLPALLCGGAFSKFCMFWCLGVFVVLSFANRRRRPAAVACLAAVVAVVVGLAFYLVSCLVLGQPDFPRFFFACLSGAILGALAGTWFMYVMEVYVGRG